MGLWAPALVAASLAGLSGGQESAGGCVLRVVTTPGTRSHYTRLGPETAKLDVGGGVEATCGDAWMRADSASYLQGQEVLWLIGKVDYRDSTRTLQADRVTYYSKDDRMVAEGRVRLTALRSGSTLTGPVVHYEPASERRPYERITAPRRSHLTVYPDREGDAGQPLEVDADRVYILGDSVVAVAGQAEAHREDFAAGADTMHLEMAGEEIRLLGSPRVISEGTTLLGDTIRAALREGEIERVEAWPHARAESEEYALSGDSIDTRMPGQRVREVIAVGRATAEAYTELAAQDAAAPKDWVSGDTVFATFEPEEPSSNGTDGEGASGGVELRQLIASGDARALYHVRDWSHPDRTSAVNYVRGERIRVTLVVGEVQEAKVEGPSLGVYIEPQPTPADTTAKGPGR